MNIGARLLRLGGNLLLAVVSVTLVLFLLEQTAKRLQLQVPFSINPSPSNCLQRSSLLSIEFRPNCAAFWSDTHFRTNELGLRGAEVRDDGSRRILAVGDSCTWGWKMDEAQSYPGVLQQLLDARAGPGQYQVINAGVPGYTSYQGLRYLRERGMLLRPWLVIIGFGFNDATRDGDVAEMIAQQGRYVLLLTLDDYFIFNSHMYKWVRWKVDQGLRGSNAPDADGTGVRKLLPQRVNAFGYTIYTRQMIELAQEAGARVMLLSLIHSPFNAGYWQALSELSKDYDVPIISYVGPKLDMVHPTVEGYQWLAAEIVDRLAQSGGLPPMTATAE